MDLNYLLSEQAIDVHSTRVLVMRHRPTEREFRKWLPLLAAENPELYNAYQRSHGATVEKQLRNANYLVSLFGRNAGEAVFIGVYRVAGHAAVTYRQYWNMPQNQALMKLGMRGQTKREDRPTSLWFDLELTEKLQRAGFQVDTVFSFNRITVPAWYINGRIFKKKRFGRFQLKVFDSLVWLWKKVDRVLPWKGLSLIAVARKPES